MAHARRSWGALLIASSVACGGGPAGTNGNGAGDGGHLNAPPPKAGGGSIGSCTVFPADNPWNADVSGLPVDPNSDAYMATMKAGSTNLHPDFGSDPAYGIPYVTVPGTQPKVPITFDYADESDPGPYPIPNAAPVEGGSDMHVLVIDKDSCVLYEMFSSAMMSDGSWHCGSGAVFDLKSNKLRMDGWTSADAAGLPIFPGLARLDEVQAGAIKHALRFTAQTTQDAFVHPATHGASSNKAATAPPMGTRVRLKASYDLSSVTGASLVILTALKTYGMYLADNGSNWYISGETNTAWNDDDLGQIKKVPASAFEVVQLGTIVPQSN